MHACLLPRWKGRGSCTQPAVSGGISPRSTISRRAVASRTRLAVATLMRVVKCHQMVARQMDAHGSQGADRGGQLKHQRAAALLHQRL
jgi:hypothetical protein